MVQLVVPRAAPEHHQWQDEQIQRGIPHGLPPGGKGYDPLAYRFFCLQSHYRKSLEFSWEALDNAAAAYGKLAARIAALKDEGGSDEGAKKALRDTFDQAMGSDLNTAMGITALYDVLKADISGHDKLALIADFDQVLSLDLLKAAEKLRAAAPEQESDPEIDALVAARTEARKAKNWAEADRIRDELKARGIVIEDTKEGVKWKRV